MVQPIHSLCAHHYISGYHLAHVLYAFSKGSSVQAKPLGTSNLEPLHLEALIALAKRYESQAAELRRLAGEIGS